MSNKIPLPLPALTQHPSGNVYFSPQQMQAYADEVLKGLLKESGIQSWKEVMDNCSDHGISAGEVEQAVFGKKAPEWPR